MVKRFSWSTKTCMLLSELFFYFYFFYYFLLTCQKVPTLIAYIILLPDKTMLKTFTNTKSCSKTEIFLVLLCFKDISHLTLASGYLVKSKRETFQVYVFV